MATGVIFLYCCHSDSGHNFLFQAGKVSVFIIKTEESNQDHGVGDSLDLYFRLAFYSKN